MLANQLARRGVRALIVDRHSGILGLAVCIALPVSVSAPPYPYKPIRLRFQWSQQCHPAPVLR